MSDLFEAIRTTILGLAPGGVFLAQAPPKDEMGRPIPKPYAVMVDLGNSFEFTSGTPYIDTHGVQISIFSDTQAQGETVRAAMRGVLDAVKITMPGAASCMMCLPEAEEVTREDDNVWHTRVDYTIAIFRNL